MTRFETELANAFDQTIAELTPEERKILAQATPEDWAKGIADCVVDPTFWAKIGTDFVAGFVKGLTD